MSRSPMLLALAGLLVLGSASAPAAARDDSSAEAARALERAVSLFDGGDSPREATMVLRDLVLLRGQLSEEDRARADRMLARPDDTDAEPFDSPKYTVAAERTCSTVTPVCLHWVESTEHGVDPIDTDGDSVPDWVETNVTTMDTVWSSEIDTFGYRPPKSDLTSPNNGGDDHFDVYLAELGSDGFFGYCTTDDPNAEPASGYAFSDVSAYCVFDNDFDPGQFGGIPALDSLQVTAAHEFFHAVQFGYDMNEHVWLFESTATWIEDELFDDINQNRDYLIDGQLGNPARSLDSGDGFVPYGNWVFWRFLTESFGTETVRETWELADGAEGGANQDSLGATESALVAAGTDLRATYASFGTANVEPASFYEEGSAYPDAPMERSHKLTTGRPTTRSQSLVRNHLTHGYISLKPGAGTTASSRVRVIVDLPADSSSPMAALVIQRQGTQETVPFTVNSAGVGRKTVDFGRGSVTRVVLVLTSASTGANGSRFGYTARLL